MKFWKKMKSVFGNVLARKLWLFCCLLKRLFKKNNSNFQMFGESFIKNGKNI